MEDYQCLRQNAKPQLSSFMFALHVDVALSAGSLLSFLAFSSKTSVHSSNCCDRTLHLTIVVHSYIWTIDIMKNNLLVAVSVVVSIIIGIVCKKALGLWKQPHPQKNKNSRLHTVHSITLINTFALYHIMTRSKISGHVRVKIWKIVSLIFPNIIIYQLSCPCSHSWCQTSLQ